jgi:hypothetical protein
VTAEQKEGLALDLACAALSKIQRLAHRQLTPTEWAGDAEPDDLATVAEIEDVTTKALEAVGRLELVEPTPEGQPPTIADLPRREGEAVLRRIARQGGERP